METATTKENKSLVLSVLSRFHEKDSVTDGRTAGNGFSEISIETDSHQESANWNTFLNPLSSTLPPKPSILFQGDNMWDISSTDDSPTNGFSSYSSAWQTTTTNEPVPGLADEIASESSGQENHGNVDRDSMSLPLNFTEISQLNKDCIIVYAVLFVFAAVGNLLVLYCVGRYDRLAKSRTPLLIMNLCIADLIVTFFLIPTEIFWRIFIQWRGGDLLCKLLQFIRAFGMYLSSNVVICISVDRYFAIVYPLKLAGAVKRVKWTLVGAWIVSAVFAAPQMFVYHVASHPEYPQFLQCVTKAFITEEPYNELIYNVSSVSALYFIPLVVIIYTYTMILWKIHQKSREHLVANSQQETLGCDSEQIQTNRTSSGSHLAIPQPHSEIIAFRQVDSTNNLSRSASKRTRLMLRSSANQTATLTRARSRTLRLTLLILLTFIICWTPSVFMTLWYMVDRGGASQVDERLQEALFIMAVTNSVLNPLIYGTVGRKQDFKKRFNLLLRNSSWTRWFLKHACCCCHTCETGDRRNSDTIIVTLNRTNGGSYRQSRVGTGAIGNGGVSNYPHMSSSPLMTKRESDFSPKSQIVVVQVQSKSSRSSSTGIVSKLVRKLTNKNRQHDGITHELTCANGRDKNECIECGSGSGATAQYIVPRGQSFEDLQDCTQL